MELVKKDGLCVEQIQRTKKNRNPINYGRDDKKASGKNTMARLPSDED
jgi:hypothetical protein